MLSLNSLLVQDDVSKRRRRSSHAPWLYAEPMTFVDANPLLTAERVGVIGDSIAYGRADTAGGWAQHLKATHCAADESRHRLWNFAVPGEKLENLVAYVLPEVSTRSIDTVLIGAGINDLIAGASPASLLSHLDRLCKELEDAGCRPVVLTPLWVDEKKALHDFGARIELATIQAYRRSLLKWGDRAHRCVIDLYPVLENRPDLLSDGIHPDARGHELIFEAIYRG